MSSFFANIIGKQNKKLFINIFINKFSLFLNLFIETLFTCQLLSDKLIQHPLSVHLSLSSIYGNWLNILFSLIFGKFPAICHLPFVFLSIFGSWVNILFSLILGKFLPFAVYSCVSRYFWNLAKYSYLTLFCFFLLPPFAVSSGVS